MLCSKPMGAAIIMACSNLTGSSCVSLDNIHPAVQQQQTETSGTSSLQQYTCVHEIMPTTIFMPFILPFWTEVLARPAVLLIALCGQVKGRPTVPLGLIQKWNTKWKGARFSFSRLLLVPVCLTLYRAASLQKWIGYCCRPEHSWVQHRIHIRLIMRESWTE